MTFVYVYGSGECDELGKLTFQLSTNKN